MYKSKLQNQIKLLSLVLVVSGIFFTQLAAPVLAIARGYQTDDAGLQVGMVAALSVNSDGTNNPSKVERATQDNSERVIGVVTTFQDSLVSISSGSANVLIENEGQVNAYISDINGDVKEGDQLVLSPLKGILMKSKNTPGSVIGLAAANMVDKTNYSYQDGSATKQTGIALTKINLSHPGSSPDTSLNDNALAKLGRSLAGHNISEIRVVIGLIIFVLVLIAEGGIIYGAVSSAVTALGRNPLARSTIRGELVRIIVVAVIVLLAGVGAVYAILLI
jgi:hypothetical protein